MENIKCMIMDSDKESVDRLERILLKFNEVLLMPKPNHPQYVVKYVKQYEPDLLFLDVELPELTGFDVIQAIRKEGFNTAIALLSSSMHYAVKAIKLNVYDYFLKPLDIEEIKACVLRYQRDRSKGVMRNESQYIDPDFFSKREQEILELIYKGYTSKAIAEKLFLSKHTIDFYRKNILYKTGCKNFVQLRNRFNNT